MSHLTHHRSLQKQLLQNIYVKVGYLDHMVKSGSLEHNEIHISGLLSTERQSYLY